MKDGKSIFGDSMLQIQRFMYLMVRLHLKQHIIYNIEESSHTFFVFSSIIIVCIAV